MITTRWTALAIVVSSLVLWSSGSGAEPSESTRLTIAAVGDIMLGRYVGPMKYRASLTSAAAFADVAPIISNADLALGNLESPILPEPKNGLRISPNKFRGDPKTATWLSQAGFDVLSIANNHALDFACVGAIQTANTVGSCGMLLAGIRKGKSSPFAPVVVRRRGLRIGVLALTVWMNEVDVPTDDCVAFVPSSQFLIKATSLVASARHEANADLVVVTVHWGAENTRHPDQETRNMARALVDAGANAVLGHHPHWVQDFEIYHGAVIAYSLGNFVFDTAAPEGQTSAILTLGFDFSLHGLTLYEKKLYPVIIDKHSHEPRIASSWRHDRWLDALKTLAPGFEIMRSWRP